MTGTGYKCSIAAVDGLVRCWLACVVVKEHDKVANNSQSGVLESCAMHKFDGNTVAKEETDTSVSPVLSI